MVMHIIYFNYVIIKIILLDIHLYGHYNKIYIEVPIYT